jgi:hypothetical protein
MQFSTADGTPMVFDSCVPGFHWTIQGYSFAYDARVLPLKCFDMIIGADWLEDHSITWIHWNKKLIKFPLGGRRLLLKGISDDIASCKGISIRKLKGLMRRSAITHCVELKRISSNSELPVVHSIAEVMSEDDTSVPPEVAQVVTKFQHLFHEPTALPPQREGDHHIPLIPGAHSL